MPARDKLTRSREYRKQRREDRRFEVFAMEYLLHKHPVIRAEIETLFDKINTRYPRKNNLTKTAEFAVWKADLADVTTVMSSSQETAAAVTTTVMSSNQESAATVTTTVMSSSQESAAAVTTAVMSSSQESAAAVTTAVMSSSQESAAAVTTAVMSSSQESAAAVTTTVMSSKQEPVALCDLDLGGTASVGNEDPWLCELNMDSRQIAELMDELNNDPELQGIMDTFCT